MPFRIAIVATFALRVSSLAAVAGDPLSTWEVRDTPAAAPLRAVTYGNGLFVAVGDQGTIIISSDGVSWSAQNAGNTAAYLSAVCWGNGLFVTVGQDIIDYRGHIFVSSNGVDWVDHHSDLWESGIAYGNGIFAIVGALGIRTSTDAVNWTPREKPHVVDLDLVTIAYGNGLFIALGENRDGYSFATSADGTTWLGQDDLQPGILINGLGFAPGEFLAVGADGGAVIERSTNAVAWSEEDPPDMPALHGAAYGDGAIVVTGGDGAIFSSASGGPWVMQRLQTNSRQYLTAISYAAGRFVAVGADFTTGAGLVLQSGFASVRLTGERSTDGTFKLTATGGIDGTRHRFQAASDLAAEWTDLDHYTVAYSKPDTTVEFVDSSATNLTRRFYRVVLSP